MAQLTEGLIREFLRYSKRGQPAPYTLNEFQQLCYAWLKLNGLPFEREGDDPAPTVKANDGHQD